MPSPDEQLRGGMAAAKEAGISLRRLYYWVEILHAVHPQVRQYGMRAFHRFTGEDLRRLKAMRRPIERGYTPRAAAGIVTGDREPS